MFRSTWSIAASADDVYAVLEDVAGYADWWPQMRSSTETGESAGTLVIGSALPHDLTIHLQQRRHDPRSRVLVARVTGDLDGDASWTIVETGPGECAATFDERVEARSPLLRRVGPLARPAFIAQHALMMRDGERGLRAWLKGGPSGGSTVARPVS